MKMVYIHGFASCGDSTKTRLLKTHFGEANVLSPDIPVEPESAIIFLEKLIEENDIDLLIGSSLGGYYATFLANKYAIKTVLINPSVKPFETLAPYVGINYYWCSGEPFEWKETYLKDLRRYEVKELGPALRFLVLLQSGDEVLDYRVAAEKYRSYSLIIENGGNHRFENLQEYLERIEGFIREGHSSPFA